MPETISAEVQQELIRQLQNALNLVKNADTSAHDVATITHSAADGHELTEVMLQQMTGIEGYLENCQASINGAIAAIRDIPLDPPPDD